VEPDVLLADAVERLHRAGASFAFLHGSRATSTARRDSDIDLAAWWPGPAPASFEIDLPAGVDLLVLNGAPLELAGRVAVTGRLVLDVDPVARVRWLATTRKIYSDEQPRLQRAHQEFLESRSRG
jgi:predicted nucleotidyltransferase